MDTSGITGANEQFRNIRNSLDACMPSAEAEAVAFLILEHLGLSRTDVVANRQIIPDSSRVGDILSRVISGEPVQYVIGEAWFHGLKFQVNPSVLIPRPETESLLEFALEVNLPAGAEVWDLATGSGVLAVCLALEGGGFNVLGTDISSSALEVAACNAKRLGAIVEFLQHDLLSGTSPRGGRPQLIVSNPPYIDEAERSGMDDRVLMYEPELALFAPKEDPLAFYRSLVAISRRSLVPGGRVMVEINQRFGREVMSLFDAAGFSSMRTERDVSGHPRFVFAVQPDCG